MRRVSLLTARNSPITKYDETRYLKRSSLRLASQSAAAIYQLNQLKAAITYIPLTTRMVLLAANLWAEQRKGHGPGHASRSPKLDGDVILTAQAIETSSGRDQIVIATMNLKDFLFIPTATVTAEEWNKI